MSNILKAALAGSVAAIIGAPALANTVTIHFDGTDGVVTSLFYDGNRDNMGSDKGYMMLDNAAAPKSRMGLARPVLPADLAGATVNSAILNAKDTWWNASVYTGVEVHRISSTVAWQPGDGDWANRWSPGGDNGATVYFANHISGGAAGGQGGTDWAGNPFTWDDTATAQPVSTALGALIANPANLTDGTYTVNGNGLLNTFDLTELVRHWADGSWANNGFAISMLNAVGSSGSRLSLLGSNGLTIDYTPVPEPASLLLLALGGLALLRRRGR